MCGMRSSRYVILTFLTVIFILLCFRLTPKGIKEFRFTPQQFLGYSFCTSKVNKQELASFSNHYPCNFTIHVPSENGVTVVTFVNSGFINMTLNWVCSAKKVGLGNSLLLITLESGVCSHFPDVSCYHAKIGSVEAANFGEPSYQKFMIERTKLILRLLSCSTKRLLLADADVVFLKNPLYQLEKELGERDIVLQRDSTGVKMIDTIAYNLFNYICGGFIYMKINNSTKLLYQSVLQFQKYQTWNDQAGLNVCIRHHSLGMNWGLLSVSMFPNGKEYFDFGSNASEAVIVHANFKSGSMEKASNMIVRDIWCYEKVGPTLCKKYWKEGCTNEEINMNENDWCLNFQKQCKMKYQIELK